MIRPMKILIAASEFAPFARTGGLAAHVERLAAASAAAGHSVTVVLPLYRCIREGGVPGLKRGKLRLQVQLGPARLPCDVWEATGPDGVRLLFLERDEFYDRTGLYGTDGRDYQDNAARFLFFAKGVAELVPRETPDVVHALGWQAAMVPVFLRAANSSVPCVLSPVGLEYQGHFWSHDFALTNLPGDWFPNVLEFYGSMNFLKAGLLCADAVALPGALQVAAMQTPEHGCGLENVLRQNADKLEGIAPGLDLPAMRPLSEKEKSAARAALFQSSGKTGRAVFVVHAASTGGDGLGLLCEALSRLPRGELLVVLAGEIPAAHRRAVHTALRRPAGGLVHFPEAPDQLLSASDFVLVPGPLHPEGVFFRAALREGLVPVAEHCAGLHELVRDFDPVTGRGNGLVYYRHSAAALLDSILRAVQLPAETRALLAERNRSIDFSWASTVRALDRLHTRLPGGSARLAA
jgi:starch synthase